MIRLAFAALGGALAGWLARGRTPAEHPSTGPSPPPDARLEAQREQLVDACVWAYESSPSRAVRQRMAHALRGVGVELLEPAGEPFDARRHERVGQEAAGPGAAPGTVAHTLRPGVLDGERVLRPAQVVIHVPAAGRPDNGGAP